MYTLQPKHAFFVGIDSDGCVFDSMELKHKECFIPQTIKHYQLQAVSKYARQTWEFVNLYSKSRGVNRFPALVETLRLLQRRPEVKERGQQIPTLKALRDWVQQETRLGNPALEQKVAETGDPDLAGALEWSQQVNEAVRDMVRGVPPFPMVRQSLAKLASHADLLVCSSTPQQALCAEWDEHDLRRFVVEICGQEAGSKTEILANASQYAADHCLMIGDAPGDQRAAQANRCLFFPIVPGSEETSWRRFHDEALQRFLGGTFAGDYQQRLFDEFERSLPEEPSFPVDDP